LIRLYSIAIHKNHGENTNQKWWGAIIQLSLRSEIGVKIWDENLGKNDNYIERKNSKTYKLKNA